jgi:tRNA A-37 threonylcarbamoyl transferase component Bud32
VSEPRTDDRLALPCSFGDYELLEKIARGGMGVIFKARHKGLDRLVALKMILTGPQAADVELEQRFAREARAAAALDHPNIVPVHDNGCHDGRCYFTMALIDGTNLQQWVEAAGPPAPREAVRLLRAVVDAVAYAHGKGVIHRDLKPPNVLLEWRAGGPSPSGARPPVPRVTDFGLARRIQDGEGPTRPGEVLGTPSYMAPEQALGQTAALGAAVDVYALGGILYFLLTGRPPFTGPTVVSVLRRVVEEQPTPPREVNSNVPPALQAICLKCLAKDPAHRYPSAAALGEALAAWEAGPDPAAAPAPRAARPATRRRRGLLLGATMALAIGGVLFALWAAGWWKADIPAAPLTGPVLPTELRRDFGLKVQLLGGREGPDGLRLFPEDEPARFRIETERDAYVGIWTIGPDGTVMQLFPNEYERDHQVRAGRPRLVPGDGRYTIDATATPPGKAEALRVVAATRRWEPLAGEKVGPFLVLRSTADRQRFEKHLRSFVLRPKAAPARAGQDAVAEEVLLYRVLPR